MLSKLKALWNGLPDSVKRVIHAFWQTFAGVFVIGLPVILAVLKAHGVSEAEKALLSLVSAAGAAGFSAVKALVVSRS